MNVVDSSAWIEYFVEGPNADYFSRPIEKVNELVVPAICLYEVFRWVHRNRGEMEALTVTAQMRLGMVIDLDSQLALSAAHLGLELRLPMADSIVFTTARIHQAVLWTQDADFENLQGVNYIAKKKE